MSGRPDRAEWIKPSTRNETVVTPMTEHPPDRLSTDPKSPFYNAELLERGVGVRFKGVEKHNVDEYCVSEGWIRVAAGTAKDRMGNPLLIKLKGAVEVYFRQEEKQDEKRDEKQ
jgi:hypothetical protein